MEDYSPEEPQAERSDHAAMVESVALERVASLGVLFRLQSLGIEEAGEVVGALEALDPDEDPNDPDSYLLKASLANVATAFDDHRVKVKDVDEQRKLKRLSVLATAVHGLALLQAIRFTVPNDSAEGAKLLTVARSNIALTVVGFPEAHEPLEMMLREAESTMNTKPA